MRPALRLDTQWLRLSCMQLTVYLTEWRGQFRSDMNRLDNAKVLLRLVVPPVMHSFMAYCSGAHALRQRPSKGSYDTEAWHRRNNVLAHRQLAGIKI